jgi:hypothetical protein
MTDRLIHVPALLLAALLLAATIAPSAALADIDEDKLGAWYMYFFNRSGGEGNWGFQGDVQYRNWNLGGDLEQLLLRGGLTWTPDSGNITLTLGYANITTGVFGSDDSTNTEHRVYQEASLPQRVADRLLLRHRFRYEQRWVDGQDFRTRYRYALFANIPLNRKDLNRGAWYLAFYNELFINGQRDIGDDRTVEYFDRNRLYGAVGYSIRDNLRLQGGYMYQYAEAFRKGQLQLSLHHAF